MLKTSWKDHAQLFVGLYYQKKGQIYFDPKARWDKTALKVSKVLNRQYIWPNILKQLPTQKHRINQNLKILQAKSPKTSRPCWQLKVWKKGRNVWKIHFFEYQKLHFAWKGPGSLKSLNIFLVSETGYHIVASSNTHY